MTRTKQDFLNDLVSGPALNKARSLRSKDYIFEKILFEDRDEYLSNGWEIEKEYKTKLGVKKPKTFDINFKDDCRVTPLVYLARNGNSKFRKRGTTNEISKFLRVENLESMGGEKLETNK